MAAPIVIQFPSDINKMVEEIGSSIFGFVPRTGCHSNRCGSGAGFTGFPFGTQPRGNFGCRPGFANCRANTWTGSSSEAEAKCFKTNKKDEAGQCRRERRCPCKPKDAKRTDLATSSEDGGLNVTLDVRNYNASELSVKIVDDFVVVEGNAEEKEADGGFVSRNFVRKFVIPEKCDKDSIMSSLSPDGTLTVKIPALKEDVSKPEERVIQIQQIGPAEAAPEAEMEESTTTTEADK